MKKKLILLLAPMMLLSCGGSKPEPTYTITFNCTDCKAYDESDKEVTSVTVPAVDPALSLCKEFHFEVNKPFKVPLKSDISIKKTGTDETVECKYVNGNLFVPIIGNLTISVTGSSYSKSLEGSSWAEIAEIAETGRADEFFGVGNTKEVTLKGQSFSHTVRIIDFNHDDLADGSGKVGITFEFANLISKNDKSSYKIGWNSSENYDYRQSGINISLNNETEGEESIVNMFPDDLRQEGIIKQVNKLVGVNESETEGKDNYKATSFSAKLFPLAYDEIHAPEAEPTDVTPGEAGNTGIYEYYKNHSGDTLEDMAYRVKKTIVDDSGWYFLRSPGISGVPISVYAITGDGGVAPTDIEFDRGIAPAFCI